MVNNLKKERTRNEDGKKQKRQNNMNILSGPTAY